MQKWVNGFERVLTCACCNHLRACKVGLCLLRTHPAFEVSVTGRNAYVAVFQEPVAKPDTRSTGRWQCNCTRVQQGLPVAGIFCCLLFRQRRCCDIELDSLCDGNRTSSLRDSVFENFGRSCKVGCS